MIDLDTTLMLTGVFTLATMSLIGTLVIRFLHKRIVI